MISDFGNKISELGNLLPFLIQMLPFRMGPTRKPTSFVEGSLAWRLESLARKVGNLSELARLSGVNNSVLSRCLKGGAPSAANAVAIAAAAEVSLEWFLTGKEPDLTTHHSNSVRIPFFQAEASAGPGPPGAMRWQWAHQLAARPRPAWGSPGSGWARAGAASRQNRAKYRIGASVVAEAVCRAGRAGALRQAK